MMPAEQRPSTSCLVPVWPLLAIGLFAIVLAAPMLGDWGGIANVEDDADGRQQMAALVAISDAFWSHGEYPLWNPRLGGGVAWAGYLYNPGISIITPVVLLAGPVGAPKVWALLVLLGAGLGMFGALRLWSDVSPGAALLTAMVVMASAWLPGRMYSGNYDESTILLAPLALVLLWGLIKGRWWGLLLPVLFSTLFAQAKFGPAIVAVLTGLFAIGAYWGQWRALGKALAWLVGAFIVGVLLSAPKLFPLAELLRRDLIDQSNQEDVLSYRSFGEVLHYLTEGYERRPLSMKPNRLLGLGPLAVVLGLAALGLGRWRVLAPWVVVATGGALLTMGPESPLPLGEWMAALPLFDAMRNFAKYWNILLLVGLAGMLAVGLEAVLTWNRSTVSAPWGRVAIVVALVAGLLVPTVYRSFRLSREAFDEQMGEMPAPAQEEGFFHVSVRELEGVVDRYRSVPREDLVPANDMLQVILTGKGFIPWYGNLQFRENAIPRYYAEEDAWIENPAYPGAEVVLDSESARATSYRVTYNTIRFEAETQEATPATINMNWHRGWTCEGFDLFPSEDGRLLVSLPANHRGEVVLRFVDHRFRLGLLVAFLGGVVWVATFVLLKRRISKVSP